MSFDLFSTKLQYYHLFVVITPLNSMLIQCSHLSAKTAVICVQDKDFLALIEGKHLNYQGRKDDKLGLYGVKTICF